MRYFLCIVAGMLSGIMGMPQDYFPNFRSVYHGHGATSYQNVQLDNYGGPNFGQHNLHHGGHLGLGSDFHGHQDGFIPTGGHHGHQDHLGISGNAFGQGTVNHADFKPDTLSNYYGNFNHGQGYEHNL